MRLLAALASIFIAMMMSLPAYAQQPGGDHPRRFQRAQPERELPRRGAGDPRQGEQGAGEAENGKGRDQRPGRLTPEERRQLRRDIGEHGRQIYRDGPRRF